MPHVCSCTGDLWRSNPCLQECVKMSFLVLMVNTGAFSSPGRMVLYVVGVACVLGFTTSLAQLPGLGTQQEMIPSGFRSRALLSTSKGSSIKVSPTWDLSNVNQLCLAFFWSNVLCASLSLQAFTTKEIIGFSIGSVSSVLYLCSRLPQMYTNVSMTKCRL